MKKYNILFFLCIYLSFNTLSFGQLSSLNDEFNSSTLDESWNLFQTQYYETPVPMSNGRMEMNLDDAECTPTCVWFLASNAGLIYKNVTGDFDVVTAVYTKQKTSPTQDITGGTQLAGLIARDPASTASGLENYVFNVTGMRFNNASIELKSTTNDKSSIKAYTDNMTTGTNAELRMVREGSVFSLYSRPIGSLNWMFRYSYTRTDLPTILQVGLISYVYQTNPATLLGQFDYIRFSEVETLSIANVEFIKNKYSIYPNPAKDKLNIKITKETTSLISASIYNVLGKRIYNLPLSSFANGTLATIDLKAINIVSGVYFLKLESDGESYETSKFVKY